MTSGPVIVSKPCPRGQVVVALPVGVSQDVVVNRFVKPVRLVVGLTPLRLSSTSSSGTVPVVEEVVLRQVTTTLQRKTGKTQTVR